MLSYNEISMYNMSLEPKILHTNVPFIILISISNRNVLHNNRERHVAKYSVKFMEYHWQ
jgi:hypothetical protein